MRLCSPSTRTPDLQTYLIPTAGHGRRYQMMISVLVALGIVVGQMAAFDIVVIWSGVVFMVVSAMIASFTGWIAVRRAAAASVARERSFWSCFGYGLFCWALGGVIYIVFLGSGGEVLEPAAWSQIGFLMAYPFWYRALWMLRQPIVAASRRERLEAGALELSAGVTIIVLVGAFLWRPDVPLAANLAQLLPVTLDLLLVGALYNAARRSVISRSSAYLWFAAGLAGLAVTDGAVSFLLPYANPSWIAAALNGYVIAIGLLAWASTQSVQATEARSALSNSHIALGLVAVALIIPASSLTPQSWRYAWWVLGALLVWRLAARFWARDRSDTDMLTGLLETKTFERYLAGLAHGARPEQPALVIAVDLSGFGAWNSRHGFAAGDLLLAEVATRLDLVKVPSDGVWGRLGPDQFIWAGIGADFENARGLADSIVETAQRNSGSLRARATFVLMPRDAQVPSDALSAIEEGLLAAKASGRTVVAFDRGQLDGAELAGGYTASLRQRRDRVQAVLSSEGSVVSVVQPIVDLASGRVVGHEALSRFMGEPRRGPDRWIAEAAAVGLGIELEAECLRRALARRADLPEGTYLSVNAGPDLIQSPLFDEAIGDGPLDWLVIEITEHDRVEEYAPLALCLSDFRGRGARVAIDDAGAGHSSMRHIMQLRPDLVKLDRSFIAGIDGSDIQRALVKSMVVFNAEAGSKLLAEGVETEEELATLIQLGVPLAQGYGLGRPVVDFTSDEQLPESVSGVSPTPTAKASGPHPAPISELVPGP